MQSKHIDSFVKSPLEAFNLVTPLIKDIEKEHLFVISLDAQKRCISCEIVSVGTICETVVYSREVFRQAIARNAVSIIVVHNHPSSDVEPSNEDILLTKKVIDAGYLLGIPLIDHIIVSATDYLSLRAYCSVKNINLFERR